MKEKKMFENFFLHIKMSEMCVATNSINFYPKHSRKTLFEK